MTASQCRFCEAQVRELATTGDSRNVQCPGCGPYKLSGTAEQLIVNAPFDAQQQANASGWLREHPDTLISAQVLDTLRNLGPLNPLLKSARLLAYIAALTKTPGEHVAVRYDDRAMLSTAWLTNHPTELDWHVEQSLGPQGFVTYTKTGDGKGFACAITPAGNEALRESKRRPLGFRGRMN